MSVITISRGSYSYGKEVAEKVARKLGYECIAREVLLEASEHFNIPEVKLIQAFEGAPSLWDRLVQGKEKYIAFIQVALLKEFQKGQCRLSRTCGSFLCERGSPCAEGEDHCGPGGTDSDRDGAR